jgi:hypothetical protein
VKPDFRAELARSGPHEMTISVPLSAMPAQVREAWLAAIGNDDEARQIVREIRHQASEPWSAEAGPGDGRGFTTAPHLVRVTRLRTILASTEKLIELGGDGMEIYA